MTLDGTQGRSTLPPITQASSPTANKREELFSRSHNLARPPERLAALPTREFALGAHMEAPELYDPLRDPHLAAYWARQSMLIDQAQSQRRRDRKLAQQARETVAEQRRRFLDRRRKDLEALSARRYREEGSTVSPPLEDAKQSARSVPTEREGKKSHATPAASGSTSKGCTTTPRVPMLTVQAKQTTKQSPRRLKPIKHDAEVTEHDTAASAIDESVAAQLSSEDAPQERDQTGLPQQEKAPEPTVDVKEPSKDAQRSTALQQ